MTKLLQRNVLMRENINKVIENNKLKACLKTFIFMKASFSRIFYFFDLVDYKKRSHKRI